MKTDSPYTYGARVLLEKAEEISGALTFPPQGPGSHGLSKRSGIAPLFGDGSDRRFFRIFSGDTTFVALVSPRTRGDGIDENDSYLKIGRHLRARGIPAPRIFFADVENGRFLLEDAGDLHLQGFVQRNRRDLEKIYRRVILMLASVHRKAPEGFSPDFCFDAPLYDARFIFERELEYFRKYFLNGCLRLEIDPEKLRPDFENLAEAAGARDMRFVFHRDFQSRNIMVRGGGLRLLDFQGMRFGPPAYDLASLLVDPYVKLPRGLQERLARLYRSSAGRLFDASGGEFYRTYAAVRLCRNMQVLGAFGFLGLVKGKRYFLDYIPWAWGQLREWLSGTCRGRYPRIEKLVARFDGELRPKNYKIE
ncbi:MAG: phosphotransferase [Syntrophobacteraceae bacterium]